MVRAVCPEVARHALGREAEGGKSAREALVPAAWRRVFRWVERGLVPDHTKVRMVLQQRLDLLFGRIVREPIQVHGVAVGVSALSVLDRDRVARAARPRAWRPPVLDLVPRVDPIALEDDAGHRRSATRSRFFAFGRLTVPGMRKSGRHCWCSPGRQARTRCADRAARRGDVLFVGLDRVSQPVDDLDAVAAVEDDARRACQLLELAG